MQITIQIKRISILTTVSFLVFVSCNNITKPIPFPFNETEFAKPVTISLEFSDPQKINWITSIPDKVKPIEIKKIELDKLPTKPFFPDGFRPLEKPMNESKFDINSLPDTILNFDAIPIQHLQIQTSFIEPPLTIKSALPKLKKNSSVGIFEFNEDEGLPGSLVTSMLQDSHGMMWIATDKGLCRFDGEHIDILIH